MVSRMIHGSSDGTLRRAQDLRRALHARGYSSRFLFTSSLLCFEISSFLLFYIHLCKGMYYLPLIYVSSVDFLTSVHFASMSSTAATAAASSIVACSSETVVSWEGESSDMEWMQSL